MRLHKARVTPLELDELEPEVRERFGGGSIDNIFRTLARHPKLLKRWLVFGNHILAKSSLPARERELLILRVGWLCQAGYEWGQHVLIARQAGLSDDEIDRIIRGPEDADWNDRDRALLRAADELHGDAFITDETWAALSDFYQTEQLIDLIFTVGQYNLVSMALNSLGVQLDERLPKFPQP